MHTRRLLPVALALPWLLLVAPPAGADCQMAGSVAEELARVRVAFVGTVTEVNGSTASFDVAEVWKGDVGAVAEVGGAFDDGSFGEDDRGWNVGATYLVLPYVEGGSLRDTICSATTEWTDELAALRPAGVETPAEPAPSGPSLLLLGIGLVVVLFAGISWMAFRRPQH
jgi:hypothetical protein